MSGCNKCGGRTTCRCVFQCEECFGSQLALGACQDCGGLVRQWTPAVVESPYGGSPGDVARNLRYLRACLHWCVHNGFTPYASHGLLTQPGVLRDGVTAERNLGIGAGLAVGDLMPVRLVFTDLGVTVGMEAGIRRGKRIGQHIETVRLTMAWRSRDVPDDLGWIWSMGKSGPEDAPGSPAWRSSK
jgi:hypothetical protein